MRWEGLFADLDAQLAAAQTAELGGEVSERSRREVARLRLFDRAREATGVPLSAAVQGAGVVTGRLLRAGPGWWLLGEAGTEQLVSTDAVSWVTGLPALAGDPGTAGPVAGRLGLGYALRGIARDRAGVTLVLRDGLSFTGTIDRVGADFLDLAEHAPGEARRQDAVRGARTVPFTALAIVRPT